MVRMEPSIEGSRTDGNDTDFIPPVGEDWIRCLAVKVLPELDVRIMEGEGEGGDIGIDE